MYLKGEERYPELPSRLRIDSVHRGNAYPAPPLGEQIEAGYPRFFCVTII